MLFCLFLCFMMFLKIIEFDNVSLYCLKCVTQDVCLSYDYLILFYF